MHIVPQRTTTTNFDLYPAVLKGEGVTVTAKFFEQTRDAITSSRSVDIEEIRSDPVGAYDIMAMMQALPSVVSGSDQYNEIIVRGGAPGEKLFVICILYTSYAADDTPCVALEGLIIMKILLQTFYFQLSFTLVLSPCSSSSD